MTQKFGRNFRITIDPADSGPLIVVTMPLTIQFWVQRNTLADLNRLSIDIYNLSEANRNRIFQDRFDRTTNRTIVFEAGYSTLYRIFQGTLYEASTAREGVDLVTRMEARSGLYDVATSQTFQTFQSGQTLGDLFKFLGGQFPTLTVGAVGDFSDVLKRPVSLNGCTWDLLKQYSDNQVYIDEGKIYVLRNAEVLPNDSVVLINDSSGLLETPRRDEGFLSITTLLETGINMAQEIAIQSSIQPVYNGQYRVIGIQHQGMISGAVCGEARSVFSLQAPNIFKQFSNVKPL